jgi:hemin uptake protein HemP
MPSPLHRSDRESPSLPALSTTPRTVTTNDLLGDARELRIVHQGEQYTLRLTRLNKLILTK